MGKGMVGKTTLDVVDGMDLHVVDGMENGKWRMENGEWRTKYVDAMDGWLAG